MQDDALTAMERKPVEWYEEIIEVRGYSFTLEVVKEAYRELSAVNRKFGEGLVAGLVRNPDESEDEFANRKLHLLRDAFCLTVSITGEHDERLYGEDISIFSSENLPKTITNIYFNNITAFQRNAGGADPANRIEVNLDFRKPKLFDPDVVLSSATPNGSRVVSRAEDITYFRAVQRVVDSKLKAQHTWYGVLHRNFAYDFGIWVLALPAALLMATYYMDKWLPIDGLYATYRWAFFGYAVGLIVLAYRFISSYAKWAFPVNVLAENRDKALKHRLVMGGMLAWFMYKVADILFGLMVPLN